jgi:hypothetical protein
MFAYLQAESLNGHSESQIHSGWLSSIPRAWARVTGSLFREPPCSPTLFPAPPRGLRDRTGSSFLTFRTRSSRASVNANADICPCPRHRPAAQRCIPPSGTRAPATFTALTHTVVHAHIIPTSYPQHTHPLPFSSTRPRRSAEDTRAGASCISDILATKTPTLLRPSAANIRAHARSSS